MKRGVRDASVCFQIVGGGGRAERAGLVLDAVHTTRRQLPCCLPVQEYLEGGRTCATHIHMDTFTADPLRQCYTSATTLIL